MIRVGAHTEVELKEKKHRLEDAISATRAAIEEGIVAGGGSALISVLQLARRRPRADGDEATGVGIVRKALVEPLRWIAQNAGLEGYVAVARCSELKAGHGLNAATGEYVDLIKAGIVDPVKVTRSAVRNAASIAGMLLTTETLVVDKPEEAEADARPRSRPLPRPGRPQPLTRRCHVAPANSRRVASRCPPQAMSIASALASLRRWIDAISRRCSLPGARDVPRATGSAVADLEQAVGVAQSDGRAPRSRLPVGCSVSR